MEPQPVPLDSEAIRVILFDSIQGTWLRFTRPQVVIQVWQISEVVEGLREVERWVNRKGWVGAGFVSYEASPAFDSALVAHPAGGLPLLWFGLFSPQEIAEATHAEKLLEGGRRSPGGYTFGSWLPNVERPAYRAAIREIKRQIAAGYTYQVNFTLRLRNNFSGSSAALFNHLQAAQGPGYCAYLELGDWIICCASPELFFRLQGEQIQMRPMKGTVKRGLTSAEDQRQAVWLANSEKNRAENVMIVDMARNDLGKIARIGSVSVPELFTLERYSTLWQMTSTVSALTNAPVWEIMQALFPCASITGAPKPRTMAIIRDLEAEPRHLYTGTIGYLSPGRQAQFNVAIRTVLLERSKNLAEYGVGGGIVWDSDADQEYDECMLKSKVLSVGAPQVFELLETILWEPQKGYFLLSQHLDRMAGSADYFGYPYNREKANQLLEEQAALFEPGPQRVRLLLGRKGDLGYEVFPLHEEVNEVSSPAPLRLRLASQAVNSGDVFLYHKTTRRQVYEKALRQVKDCEDVILWNERGEITETTRFNLMFERDGKWFTPAVSCGLLAGVYRGWLIGEGKLSEVVVRMEDLASYPVVYVINSVRKLRPAVIL